MDSHAPVTRTKFTRPPAPWMKDQEIVETRDRLKHFRRNRNLDRDTTNYKTVRNKYKKLIRKKKSEFIRKKLSSKNPKEIWSTIHRILDPPSQRINQDPDKLNEHYTSLASKLCNKPNNSFKEGDILNSHHVDSPESFEIEHTSYETVHKILMELRNDCSSGFDHIPPNLIKPVIDQITSLLVHIINNSIDKGIFPDHWKIARVCPIPKIKQPVEPKDFRPVSILPLLSKVFEKVILKQLLPFVEGKVYKETQSGFRKGHSTATLLLKFRDDIKKAMNANEVTLSVLIDYSKAFDTIDHVILLKKLISFGFSRRSTKLFTNYLTNRRQYVQIEDKKSKILPIYFGVPQGSILGPILFNLYVSELSDQINSTSIQYADDTTVARSSTINNIKQNIKTLENDIASLSNWSQNNGLLFNNDKLQFIIFWKKRTAFPTDRSFLIKSSGKSIKQEQTIKLLGITMDQNLNWIDHINKLTKSLYSSLQILKRFKRSTPFKTRKTLAEGLILSKLNYCNAVYAPSQQYLLNRLQRYMYSWICNRKIRKISGCY